MRLSIPLGSTVDLALLPGWKVIFQIKDEELVFRQQISNYCLSHFIGVGMSATYQVPIGASSCQKLWTYMVVKSPWQVLLEWVPRLQSLPLGKPWKQSVYP